MRRVEEKKGEERDSNSEQHSHGPLRQKWEHDDEKKPKQNKKKKRTGSHWRTTTTNFQNFSIYKRESISRVCNTCDFKSLCQYTKPLKIILSPSGINKPRTAHSHSVKKGVWWWWRWWCWWLGRWWWCCVCVCVGGGSCNMYACLSTPHPHLPPPPTLYFSFYVSLSLVLCSIKP